MTEEFYNERKCKGLINVLSKIDKNKVICVDGAWGTGKSYFCKKLIELSKDRFECIKFNAFEHDHNDEPLVLLLGEFSKAVSGSKQKEFIKEVSVYAAPLVEKSLSYLVAVSGLREVPVLNEAGGGLKDYLEKRINSYLYAEKSVKGIRDELKKVVDDSPDKKIIVIIDELDRCRPSFSLEIIEKIKHIFNVEGVHFILSMHKLQVLDSINHAYGISNNSESYLEKFIDFTIYLTPEVVGDERVKSPQANYAFDLASRSFKEVCDYEVAECVASFCAFLTLRNKMEFREVDRFVDKCLTAYVSYNEIAETEKNQLMSCALVSNVFISIYEPEYITKGEGSEPGFNSVLTQYVLSLLIGGYVKNNLNKNLTNVKKLSGADNVFMGGVFYDIVLNYYVVIRGRDNDSAFSNLDIYINDHYDNDEILRYFSSWRRCLTELV